MDNRRTPGKQPSSEMAESKQAAAMPKILISTEGSRKNSTHDERTVSEDMDHCHLEAKLNASSSSSEISLGNVEDDCFEKFRKRSSTKIGKIETWMRSINEKVDELKKDDIASDKVKKTVDKLEAEIKHLMRTSPLTISDDKERNKVIRSRAVRLEAIKEELMTAMEYFQTLEKKYDDRLEEIERAVAAFPNGD